MRGLLLALLLLASGAQAEQAGALRSDPAVPLRGPAQAAGALVWIHPFARDLPAPAAPAWTGGLTGAGWDLWRFDRAGGPDPLAAGAERLIAGTAALRDLGYRRIVLLGESRGAFIALVALRHAGLADAVVLAAPAAHGRSTERRPQALADFAAALQAASPQAARRIALLLFADDSWDPDPAQRAALFAATARRLGMAALLVDRPAAPVGHGGLQEPDFAARLAPCLLRFLDLDRSPPATCP